MSLSYSVSRILDDYPGVDPREVEARLGYGSFVSLRNRFIYIDVPKAASTAMKMLFRELEECEPLKLYTRFSAASHRSEFIHARENVPLPPLTTLSDRDQRELLEAPDVLRFTIVRNPYERLVSAWRDKVFPCDPGVQDVFSAVRGSLPAIGRKCPISFAEFVSHIETTARYTWDGHWQRQVDLTFPKSLSFTHIGRVEAIEATVELLNRKLHRMQAIHLPRLHESPLRPAPNIYPELAARVYGLYEEDFTAFGYDPESWPRDPPTSPCGAEERLIDGIIERNIIIAHLARETERLKQEYSTVYRSSLARVRNKLQRVGGSFGWKRIGALRLVRLVRPLERERMTNSTGPRRTAGLD